MIKNPRNLLWLIPLLLLASSPLWKPAVSSFLQPRTTYEKSHIQGPDSQHFQMETVDIILTNKGEKEWLIKASRAQTGETDREIWMEDVRANYIGENKDPMIITSNKGKYFIQERHLLLNDDVVIEKPLSNELLFTDLLHYYDATQMAISPADVEIKAPSFTIESGRLDYDISTEGYDFSNRVKVDL